MRTQTYKIDYWNRYHTAIKPSGIVFHYQTGALSSDVHIPKAIADMPYFQRILMGKGIEIVRVNK